MAEFEHPDEYNEDSKGNFNINDDDISVVGIEDKEYKIRQIQQTNTDEHWSLSLTPSNENITFSIVESKIVIRFQNHEGDQTLCLSVATITDTQKDYPNASGLFQDLKSSDINSIMSVLYSILVKPQQQFVITITGKHITQIYTSLLLNTFESARLEKMLSVFASDHLSDVRGVYQYYLKDVPKLSHSLATAQPIFTEQQLEQIEMLGSFGIQSRGNVQIAEVLSYSETDFNVNELIISISSQKCNWVLIQDVFFFAMFRLLFSGYHFDIFFSLCSNAMMNLHNSAQFSHLPFVPGELASIQILLYEASYSHTSNLVFFMKVAFRAELAITSILPYKESLHFYNYCLDVALGIGDPVLVARMRLIFGRLLGQCKNYLQLAHIQYNRALDLLEPRGKSIDLAWLLTLNGWNLFSRGLIVGREYIIQAFRMLQELLEFSTCAFRHPGSSLFSLGPSLMEEEERRLEQRLSAAASSLGLLFLDLGKPQEALKYFDVSLRLRQQLWQLHPLIGKTFNNISLCYQRLGNHIKALDYSRKGLDVKRQFKGNGKEMVNSLNNVAINCSLVSGSHQDAVEMLQEALLIQENLDLDLSDTATIYTSFAFVYQRMGRLDAALIWYQKAVDLRQEISGSTHPTTMRVVIRLARILFQQRRYKETEEILEHHVGRHESVPIDGLDEYVNLLKDVYLKTGNLDKFELIQQKSLQEYIIFLNGNQDTTCFEKGVGNMQMDSIKDDSENSLQEEDAEDIDSDEDLYGPDDSSGSTVICQEIVTEQDECVERPSSGKATLVHSQSEEDLYSSNAGDTMSISSTPEPGCDGHDWKVEDLESPPCLQTELSGNIRSPRTVLHPVAQTTTPANNVLSKGRHEIQRPQPLNVSSRSAFTSVSTEFSNRPDNFMTAEKTQSLITSVTGYSNRPSKFSNEINTGTTSLHTLNFHSGHADDIVKKLTPKSAGNILQSRNVVSTLDNRSQSIALEDCIESNNSAYSLLNGNILQSQSRPIALNVYPGHADIVRTPKTTSDTNSLQLHNNLQFRSVTSSLDNRSQSIAHVDWRESNNSAKTLPDCNILYSQDRPNTLNFHTGKSTLDNRSQSFVLKDYKQSNNSAKALPNGNILQSQSKSDTSTFSRNHGNSTQFKTEDFREIDNPFHSSQLGFEQYHPEPTYIKSLAYQGNQRSYTPVAEKENMPLSHGVDIVDGTRGINDKSNGTLTFDDLDDIKTLTKKQIEGTNNVLRFLFGPQHDDK